MLSMTTSSSGWQLTKGHLRSLELSGDTIHLGDDGNASHTAPNWVGGSALVAADGVRSFFRQKLVGHGNRGEKIVGLPPPALTAPEPRAAPDSSLRAVPTP
jgi:hypothetical protein